MTDMNLEKFALRLLTGILIFFLLLGMLPLSVPVQAAIDPGKPIVVSVGDSFSSGEGIEEFIDQDLPIPQRVKDQDWLAHRSKNSWPGRLQLSDGNGTYTLESVRDENWYFCAVSGAVAANLTTEYQKKEYSKKDSSGTKHSDTEYIPPQLQVFSKELKGKSVDYVTVTIGGNDMGFSNIIINCVLESRYLDLNILPMHIAYKWTEYYLGDIQKNINQVYSNIEAAAGSQAHIIVAGYPRLTTETGLVGFFNPKEILLVNNSVTHFNKSLENLIKKRQQAGMNISFVSVEDEFLGHGAYTLNSYINPVIFGALDQDLKDIQISSAYSMHPNDKGAQAYADCVQPLLDQLEAERKQHDTPDRISSEERDVVLVLDTSGSMSGNMSEVREASNKFVDTVLQEDASIGIVTYDSYSDMRSDFSQDADQLNSTISSIYTGGQTNIEAGLLQADLMLSNSSARKKIIVLMSDGMPNRGKEGSELIAYAKELKDKGIYLYTLGFFKEADNVTQAQQLMEQMASPGCHYEVDDAEKLVYFFGDIADQISGQNYIYIRIACPVDVTVKYDGQTLRSDLGRENTRTDFGTLSFEENAEEAEDDSDNRIKILRLKEGPEYDIKIEGNGRGKMNYTIGFMDEDGEYSDLREFRNIKITRKTVIDTVAAVSDTTTLKVDEDGDGSYDLEYEAERNSRGKLVETNYLLYIAIIGGGVIVVLVVVLILVLRSKKKKRTAE